MTPTTYGRDFAYCLKSHGGVRGFNASLWRFLLRCTLFCHSVATFLTSVSSYEGGCGFEDYIFNNRKFSYPAAFSQSTNQRRNAGTFIAGFSISKHNLDFDYEELPEYIQEKMNPGMKVNKIKYTNANISFGYAYNWVFARNCLACISLTPAIAYKASDVDAETHEGKQWYSKFNLDFLIRAGIVYNNGKYFVGSSFVGKNYNYHRNNFSLDNGFGTLQVYAGFNFHLRKEYRKNK